MHFELFESVFKNEMSTLKAISWLLPVEKLQLAEEVSHSVIFFCPPCRCIFISVGEQDWSLTPEAKPYSSSLHTNICTELWILIRHLPISVTLCLTACLFYAFDIFAAAATMDYRAFCCVCYSNNL